MNGSFQNNNKILIKVKTKYDKTWKWYDVRLNPEHTHTRTGACGRVEFGNGKTGKIDVK